MREFSGLRVSARPSCRGVGTEERAGSTGQYLKTQADKAKQALKYEAYRRSEVEEKGMSRELALSISQVYSTLDANCVQTTEKDTVEGGLLRPQTKCTSTRACIRRKSRDGRRLHQGGTGVQEVTLRPRNSPLSAVSKCVKNK